MTIGTGSAGTILQPLSAITMATGTAGNTCVQQPLTTNNMATGTASYYITNISYSIFFLLKSQPQCFAITYFTTATRTVESR